MRTFTIVFLVALVGYGIFVPQINAQTIIEIGPYTRITGPESITCVRISPTVVRCH